MWRHGKRESLAMLVGSLAYALLLFVGIWGAVALPDSPAIGERIGDTFWFLFYGVNMFPLPSAVITGCILAVPFFVGTRFGPWAGLVCAVVGRFLGERLLALLPLFANTLPPSWFAQQKELYLVVYGAWALFGFIPGLVSGMRKKTDAFAFIAVIASVFAILLADLLLYFVESGYAASNYYGPLSALWSTSGVSLALSYLAGLVVLILFLLLTEHGSLAAKRSRSVRT